VLDAEVVYATPVLSYFSLYKETVAANIDFGGLTEGSILLSRSLGDNNGIFFRLSTFLDTFEDFYDGVIPGSDIYEIFTMMRMQAATVGLQRRHMIFDDKTFIDLRGGVGAGFANVDTYGFRFDSSHRQMISSYNVNNFDAGMALFAEGLIGRKLVGDIFVAFSVVYSSLDLSDIRAQMRSFGIGARIGL
jgi:hypothetical protein